MTFKMSNACVQVSKHECNKILREAQGGNIEVIKKFHHDYPEIHWSYLRYDKTGDTILHAVSRLGYTDVIEYLMKNFQPNGVNCRNNDNKTALHEAAQFSQYRVAKLLIKNGADVNVLKRADWTPLMLACTKIEDEASFKTIEVLLENGGLVNYKNKDGWTTLHLIAREGDVHILKLLLDYGLNIRQITKNGRCALHVAALHGNYDMAIQLIRLGLDVNMKDSCGNTPLHEAVLGENLEICEVLLNSGADANTRNKSGFSILHLAASQGNISVITYFIEDLKFNPNISTNLGLTPLHCAAHSNRTEAYDLLVNYNADEEAKDDFGRMPAYYRKY